MLFPLRSRRTNVGAGLCRRPFSAAPEDAIVPSRRTTASRATLAAGFNAIALPDPVIAEVAREIENLHVLEPELEQPMKSRTHIRASVPWAAAAVNHDGRVLLETRHLRLEQFQSLSLGARPGVLRAADMGLAEHHVRSHLQDN